METLVKRTTNARLQSAQHLISGYEGSNLVKCYSKKYGVDKLCAIKELRILGIEVSSKYESELIRSMQVLKNQRQKGKEKIIRANEGLLQIESDEYFAFIVDYTSGGMPFGVTHEEMDELNRSKCQ